MCAVLLNFNQIILLICFFILLISFFVCLPKTKFKKNSVTYVRVFFHLLLALFILLPNYGQDWEAGSIETRTQYMAGCGEEINATIGVKIGMRSINVTLKADSGTEDCIKYEVIDYNEQFDWSHEQATILEQEINSAKLQGSPKPIIWVIEYFLNNVYFGTYETHYFRIGRYCQICMWGSFGFYLIAVIMFRTVLNYGIYCLAASGLLQLLANLLWYILKNPVSLEIMFEDGNLTTKCGFSFWLNFYTGIFSITLSLIFLLMEYMYESTLYWFFGVDPADCYNEVVYLSKYERYNHLGKQDDCVALRNIEERNKEDEYDYAIYFRRRPSTLTLINPKFMRRSHSKQSSTHRV